MYLTSNGTSVFESTPWNFCTDLYLVCVNALRHGPGGDDEVHDPLAQTFGNLVKFKEVTHIVEHLVVAICVGVHLLEDGGDVSKDCGI